MVSLSERARTLLGRESHPPVFGAQMTNKCSLLREDTTTATTSDLDIASVLSLYMFYQAVIRKKDKIARSTRENSSEMFGL